MYKKLATSMDFSDVTIQTLKANNIEGKDYLVREASTAVARKFKNSMSSNVTVKKGKTRVSNLGDLEIELLEQCMTTKNGQKVDAKTIDSWPNRISSKLVEWIKEVSELETDDEDDEDDDNDKPKETKKEKEAKK